MSELTPAEMAELRRLHEAGTPGEWRANKAVTWCGGTRRVVEHYVHRDGDDVSIAAEIADPVTGEMSEDNARLVAAARNAIPRLLDLVEQLRAELAKTERADELEWMGQAKDGRDLYAVKATRQEGSGKNG